VGCAGCAKHGSGEERGCENLDIVRDRVHITLVSGTIQFAKPVNGVVFAAIFHGEGKVRLDPPNATEARQIYLFTRQEKLDLSFSDATFSSTDGLFEEIAKQVKWRPGGASDDLYAKRQQERESLGAEQLPRLFKSVMSPDRKLTGYFLADLKSKDKTSETTDGKELVTTWKSDIPLALPVSRSGITKYLQIGSATSKFRCMRIVSRMNSCKVFSNTLRIQSTILPWGLEGGRILVRPCLRSAA
jgi:hypothetical protein